MIIIWLSCDNMGLKTYDNHMFVKNMWLSYDNHAIIISYMKHMIIIGCSIHMIIIWCKPYDSHVWHISLCKYQTFHGLKISLTNKQIKGQIGGHVFTLKLGILFTSYLLRTKGETLHSFKRYFTSFSLPFVADKCSGVSLK